MRGTQMAKVKKNCEYCDKEFDVHDYRKDIARFCSHVCYAQWLSANIRGERAAGWRGGKQKEYICRTCGKAFVAYSSVRRLYCSNNCYKPDLIKRVVALELGKTRKKHGRAWRNGKSSVDRTYMCWAGLRSRCNNPNDPDFKNYGGRGIKCCERWNNFEMFLEDMGEKPEGFSIDRINVDGNYEPDNCRWATSSQQGNNRRNNITITYNNETHTLAEWAKRLGFAYELLLTRYNRNWTTERMLTTSTNKHRRENNERCL
jgi:hypothetical protein